MKPQRQKIFGGMLAAILTACLLSACGAAEAATPTPTEVSVEAIYTAGAQTMIAQLTSTAAAKPTETPTPSPTATPTATITPTPSNTSVQFFAPPVVITATLGTPGPTFTPTLGAVGCNDSAFLADVTVPDGTTVKADSNFTKSWSIKNTGTCAWTFDFKFTFIGGELMNSDTFKIRRTVGPSTSTEISVVLTAPSAPGTYTGYWRMADDKGVQFGVSFRVSIKVDGATYTPKPAATATETTPPTVAATRTPTSPPPTATVTPILVIATPTT